MRTTHESNTETNPRLTEITDVDQLVNEVKDAIMIDIAMTADLDDFLSDPIGYGDFDYLNPISLEDYDVHPRMHGFYIEPIT